jgi:hypothetical protein
MLRLAAVITLILIGIVLGGVLTLGAVQRGLIEPPTGTARLGPITVMALPPCPSVPPQPNRWGRGCGSASPWSVWLFVRDIEGKRHQWKVMSMVVDP